MRTLVQLALAALLALAPVAASAAEFVVIAHPSVPATALTRADASRLFLRLQSEWPGGVVVRPVDQAKSSPVREAFSRAVLGRSISAVEQYWTQAIFSGRAVPPVEKRADADVVAYVRENAGAIGYVSESAALEGVKKITLKD